MGFLTGYREDYNDDEELLKLKKQNEILREALYDISIACQENFPADEIVTDVFRISRKALDDVA